MHNTENVHVESHSASNMVDMVKTICTVLIVGSHCLPLFSGERANLVYGQWFFRFCVPFYFISTGYFFQRMNNSKRKSYIGRIFLLYFFSTLLYLPYILDTCRGITGKTLFIVLAKTFQYGYIHLWYLASLFIGLAVCYIDEKICSDSSDAWRLRWLLSFLLLCFAALFDEYYHLFQKGSAVYKVGLWIDLHGTTRSGITMAFPLLTVGRGLSRCKIENLKKSAVWAGFALVALMSYIEFSIMIHILPKEQVPTIDISFCNWMPAVFLFVIALQIKPRHLTEKTSRLIRKSNDIVYIIHLIVIDQLGKIGLLKQNRSFLALLISYGVAIIGLFFMKNMMNDRKGNEV
ncbi:MAG: acyltransferase [Bulleidia sp.]|nr:acyltransferase [Bulleidia sp.]